jgi:diguanylate cyclase (GGDEF)-like protein
VPTPSPGDPFFELLAETLENLDRPARGQFLQRFFKTVAQLDLTETSAVECWDRILERRRELTEALATPVSLKTAMVDVLASMSYLRLPVLMEYEDLKKLQINAVTDPLTGLYNRRLFEEQFERELNRAQRYAQNLALVTLDLHRFKEVNDLYGHPRGDALLQVAASTLKKSLRTSDYAFRIGGDEFALLLVQSDTEQAGALARRLRANFATAIEPMEMSVALGLDFGVSIYPLDGDQRETLIRIADERLYEMKHVLRSQAPPTSNIPASNTPAAPASETVKTPASAPPQSPGSHSHLHPVGSGVIPPLEIHPPAAIRQARANNSPHDPAHPVFSGPERRKWERVSLAGTRAHAELTDHGTGIVKVLDLGYGGVALEIGVGEDFGATFFAVLRVPILPPVRVSLKRLYQIPSGGGQMRVGCTFVT